MGTMPSRKGITAGTFPDLLGSLRTPHVQRPIVLAPRVASCAMEGISDFPPSTIHRVVRRAAETVGRHAFVPLFDSRFNRDLAPSFHPTSGLIGKEKRLFSPNFLLRFFLSSSDQFLTTQLHFQLTPTTQSFPPGVFLVLSMARLAFPWRHLRCSEMSENTEAAPYACLLARFERLLSP